MAKRIQMPRSGGANGRRSATQSGTANEGRWSEIAPYALISLVCFVLGLGVLVVLLPLGLAVAGFLFGVLRS